MTDLKLLKELGVTQAALKRIFTTDKPDKKIKPWKDRMANRIKESIDRNTSSDVWRTYWAIDRAIDSPFYQKSRTLFEGLLDHKSDSKKVLSLVNAWGLDNWMTCGCGKGCTNCNSCEQQILDIPALFEVKVPIALAYKRIRVARIFNDRNLVPLFPYYPANNTAQERMRCQIIQSRVQMQSQQMGYSAVMRQAIDQALTYGICLTFPKESWYHESHPTADKDKRGKRKHKTIKEGVRYEHPHPSRIYWDLAHPAYSINTNTGCQYAGYWTLVRYKDVAENDAYWNKDKITWGKGSFHINDANATFFATVYPCTAKFPTLRQANNNDRLEEMQVYTTKDDNDRAVLLTNHFELVNPLKDWGLTNKEGDGYDGPVWFRCTVGSDDTVLYAEPIPYTPPQYWGYDADANRFRSPSLVLECIPAEDMIGNLLSQGILQAQNNLTNVNFVNSDYFDEGILKQIKNMGSKSYRSPQFIEYSRHERPSMDLKSDAITPVPIQRMPIQECLVLIRNVLDLLERTLVMSSQEIGAAATHEQTAQEVLQTTASTSVRLSYTASFMDDAIDAWRNQLYEAGLAYWDDEIFGQVALQSEADRKALETLGFKVEDENDHERTAGVRGSKQTLGVSGFTVRRDAPDRINSERLAANMVQLFSVFAAQPTLIAAVGAKQFIEVFNKIADVAGLQKDFRLTAVHDPIEEARKDKEEAKKLALEDRQFAIEDREKQTKMAEQAQGAGAQLQQILPALEKKVAEGVMGAIGEQLKPVFEKSAQVDQQQQQDIEGIGQAEMQTQQRLTAAEQAIQQIGQIFQQATQPPVPQGMV